jgi:hypothetical protein
VADVLPNGGRSWTVEGHRFAFVLPVTNDDQFPADISAVSADSPPQFDTVEVGLSDPTADPMAAGTVLSQQVPLAAGEPASIVIRGVINCPVPAVDPAQRIYLTVDGQHTELDVGLDGSWAQGIVDQAC